MVFRRIFAAQQRLYERLPGTASFCTGMVMMGIGDTGVQLAGSGKVDVVRTSSVSLYSGMSSPIVYNWWRWLDKMWPGRTALPVLRKTITNQVAWGTANSLLFMSCSKLFEAWLGGGPRCPDGETDWELISSQISHKIRAEVPGLLVLAGGFWVPANYFSFMFIPVQYRIIYSSTLGVAWGGFLSHVAHR
mmetsp:Transcript_39424/g.104216  ORF Transcript_39424/g.104216 Transcript_39424/m.104216 type:complete len:190 (+) Transcript_39424:196-765(+)